MGCFTKFLRNLQDFFTCCRKGTWCDTQDNETTTQSASCESLSSGKVETDIDLAYATSVLSTTRLSEIDITATASGTDSGAPTPDVEDDTRDGASEDDDGEDDDGGEDGDGGESTTLSDGSEKEAEVVPVAATESSDVIQVNGVQVNLDVLACQLLRAQNEASLKSSLIDSVVSKVVAVIKRGSCDKTVHKKRTPAGVCAYFKEVIMLVRGSLDQSKIRGKYQGNQCSSMALVALCYTAVTRVESWTAVHIDDIIKEGNRIHTIFRDKMRLSDHADGRVSLEDLPRTYQLELAGMRLCTVMGDHAHTFTSITESIAEFSIGAGMPSLAEYIESQARNVSGDTGFLITVVDYSYLVFRTEYGAWHLFDSHGGLRYKANDIPGTLAASVATFATAGLVVAPLIEKHGAGTQSYVVSMSVIALSESPVSVKTPPSAVSPVFAKSPAAVTYFVSAKSPAAVTSPVSIKSPAASMSPVFTKSPAVISSVAVTSPTSVMSSVSRESLRTAQVLASDVRLRLDYSKNDAMVLDVEDDDDVPILMRMASEFAVNTAPLVA